MLTRFSGYSSSILANNPFIHLSKSQFCCRSPFNASSTPERVGLIGNTRFYSSALQSQVSNFETLKYKKYLPLLNREHVGLLNQSRSYISQVRHRIVNVEVYLQNKVGTEATIKNNIDDLQGITFKELTTALRNYAFQKQIGGAVSENTICSAGLIPTVLNSKHGSNRVLLLELLLQLNLKNFNPEYMSEYLLDQVLSVKQTPEEFLAMAAVLQGHGWDLNTRDVSKNSMSMLEHIVKRVPNFPRDPVHARKELSFLRDQILMKLLSL